jgi:hypothetical protein
MSVTPVVAYMALESTRTPTRHLRMWLNRHSDNTWFWHVTTDIRMPFTASLTLLLVT